MAQTTFGWLKAYGTLAFAIVLILAGSPGEGAEITGLVYVRTVFGDIKRAADTEVFLVGGHPAFETQWTALGQEFRRAHAQLESEKAKAKAEREQAMREFDDAGRQLRDLELQERFLPLSPPPDFPYRWYLQAIHRKIQERWEGRAIHGRQPEVVFEIARDGQLRNVQVTKGSGNPAYDELAIRAVAEAHPFPPLPDGFPKPVLTIRLQFGAAEQAAKLEKVRDSAVERAKDADAASRLSESRVEELRAMYRKKAGDLLKRSAVKTTRTDITGRYTFTAVKPGRYHVFAGYTILQLIIPVETWWMVPIEIKAARQTLDLSNSNSGWPF